MPIPRVKTEATSVESPKSKCGDNWDKNIKVRNPYKGVDKFARSLLSLAEVDLVNARDDELPAQLELERARAKKLRGDHKSILNSEQRANVDKYLGRAQVYLKDAAKIQKLWASGFATAGYGLVSPFAINTDVSDIANGFCLTKPPGYKAKNKYEADCPPLEEVQGHAKDAEKWGTLILASMKNIRCADEVIRKTEVLRLNKAEWEKTAPKPQIEGGGILSAATQAVEPQPMPTEPAEVGFSERAVVGGLVGGGGPAGATPDLDELDRKPDFGPGHLPEDLPSPDEPLADEEEVGDGVLEDEKHVGAIPPKKKKKSNVPLIAAVGIGAVLLLK